ncbi:hypothetical protein HY419_00745, partial [candidate division WWE3 bacterium]|nr:hypothetical protein [candidate division WWE3 bacterium]
MKIGINASALNIEYFSGPENYTYRLIKALAQIDGQNEYTLYFKKNLSPGIVNAMLQERPNFQLKILKPFLSWTQVSLALELLKHPVDIFFTPVHTIPELASQKQKIVVMIHGLEFLDDRKSLLRKTLLLSEIK